MMKTLYLIYKSCSRFFLKELFLIVQLTAVIILLNTAITPFVNYLQLEGVIASGMPSNPVYYSSPTFSDLSDNYTKTFLETIKTDEDVASVCMTYRTTGTADGKQTDVLLYNKAVFDCMSSTLDSGNWNYDTSKIYINSALYKSSESKQINLIVQDALVTGRYDLEIAGVTDDIVYSFSVAGSQPELTDVGTDFEYLRNIHPNRNRYLVIVPYDFESDDILYNHIDSVLIELKENVDADRFVAKYASSEHSEHIYTKEELTNNSLDRLIDTYKIDALIGILLTVASLFGIGGYTYLKTKKLQKQMAIYMICGCRSGVYRKIVLLSNAIILSIAATGAFLLRNVIVLGEGRDTPASFLISFVFILVIYIVPVVITLYSSGKLMFLKLLYYGD